MRHSQRPHLRPYDPHYYATRGQLRAWAGALRGSRLWRASLDSCAGCPPGKYHTSPLYYRLAHSPDHDDPEWLKGLHMRAQRDTQWYRKTIGPNQCGGMAQILSAGVIDSLHQGGDRSHAPAPRVY